MLTGSLHAICELDYSYGVDYLLEEDAEPSIRNKKGVSPLEVACNYGNVDTVELLCTHGANINDRCSDGRTLLCMACDNDDDAIVNLLLTHGADVNAVNNDDDGDTALHVACRRGCSFIQELLLKYGAKRDIVNAHNKTAFYVASSDIRCPNTHEDDLSEHDDEHDDD